MLKERTCGSSVRKGLLVFVNEMVQKESYDGGCKAKEEFSKSGGS